LSEQAPPGPQAAVKMRAFFGVWGSGAAWVTRRDAWVGFPGRFSSMIATAQAPRLAFEETELSRFR